LSILSHITQLVFNIQKKEFTRIRSQHTFPGS